MGFTRHATDLFLSSKIAQVTVVGASDVSLEFPESGRWVSSFGLSVILCDHPPAQHRQFALQFVRRVEMAFAEYSLARGFLVDLVGNPGRWSPYYRALYHFEAAIAQLYLAHDGGRKALAKSLFQSGDGSVLDRLNKIFNASKHELASSDQTVWITNAGLSTGIPAVTFAEIEDLLRECGRIADRIVGQSGLSQDAQQGHAAGRPQAAGG